MSSLNLSRSVLAILLFANTLPLFGVLYWNWGVFELIYIYWFENVILGVLQLVKMAFNQPSLPLNWFLKLFYMPFFTLHYGMFTFAHGVILLDIFAPHSLQAQLKAISMSERLFFMMQEPSIYFMAMVLFVSNGALVLKEYFLTNRFQEIKIVALMFEPYGRIVVLHVTLLLSAYLLQKYHEPLFGLIVLIGVKLIFELIIHREKKSISSL